MLQLLLFTALAIEHGLAQPNNGGGPPRAAAVSAYAEGALCSLCTGPVLPPGAAALRAPVTSPGQTISLPAVRLQGSLIRQSAWPH